MDRTHLLADLKTAAHQYNKEKEYWLNRLSGDGDLVKSFFPYDFKKVNIKKDPADKAKVTTGTVKFKITGELFSKLITISRSVDQNLHMVLTANLVVLLHIYTGRSNILVGTPIYRPGIKPEKDFINTALVLRNPVNPGMTFKELLLQVRETVVQAVRHQNYPVELLPQLFNIPYSEPDDFPLFDAVILLENIHDKAYLQHLNYNINFSFLRKDGDLDGVVEYHSQSYRQPTVRQIINHFMQLLAEVLNNPDIKISGTDVLSDREKQQLLLDFNDTAANYPRDKTIHRLFEAQVRKTPDQIAAVGPAPGKYRTYMTDRTYITYRELNKKSHKLACLLRQKGVKPDTIVGVIVSRSPEMITALIAILKAGGAYLPIETDLSASRVLSILEDAHVPILLTESPVLDKYSFTMLQGIHYSGSQTDIHVTAPAPPITDLDRLPYPDRSLVNYEKYNQYIGLTMVKNIISIQATRGCPYHCAYCHKIWPKTHVIRSAENIFAEVKLYYDMGVKRFAFVDDIFNLDRKNSTRFFEMIIKSRMEVQLFFPNGMRGDMLSKDYIDQMVEAGTVGLGLALETASPRLQKLIKKNLNLEKLRENIEYFCETYPGVILELFTMHGFPTETEEEALMTMDFIKSFKWLHFPYVHILKIYPNTEMEALAIKNGIPAKAITGSVSLAYHELPGTLPFDKRFTLTCQADFLNGYFLSRERLLAVLPLQMKTLTEDEIRQKYDSYLPTEIKSFPDLLELAGISADQLGTMEFPGENRMAVPNLNEKIKKAFPREKVSGSALNVLLLDLSQFFRSQVNKMLYDVVEPPLGLIYVLTYLKQQLGGSIKGKIAKSRIDFDNYQELKTLLEEFKPDVIGIRTLTFYKDFFHRTIAMIRQWGIDVPILAGGPYATSDYKTILQDPHVDIVVLGEGELTACRVIKEIINNKGKLPPGDVLETIPGIAFVPGKRDVMENKPGMAREIVMMDALEEKLAKELPDSPGYITQPTNLAYVIYTSGSTGKPKGAMIDHQQVVRLMFNDRNPFDFDHRDVWTMFHSYSFDFSVWEMYGALLFGGKMVVIPQMVARDPGRFLEVLKEQKVTVLNQTPTAFYQLINQELQNPVDRLNLRLVIFGGEALNPGKLRAWRDRYPQTKLVNMFGITETTVHVTYKEITDNEINQNISNIGRPIPTLSTYVLAEDLRLLPLGVPGELYVGGAGVARGYLNQPELTAERFIHIKDYYMSHMSHMSYIYRSGDLVRLLPNGEMEYLGRKDRQVQLRGFRIEPGEIEHWLLNYKGIKDAVAAARTDQKDNLYLCAYIVPESAETFSREDLRHYLETVIPGYMIPAYFVALDNVPLTPNGKVDIKALPEPGSRTIEDGEPGDYSHDAASTSPGETRLVNIWKRSLELEKVRITDNYFNIGGDSIKAIHLVNLINSELNVKLTIPELYTNETIEKLAKVIRQKQEENKEEEFENASREIQLLENEIIAQHHSPGNIEHVYPMSDIETGMIYLSTLSPGEAVYHDQNVYYITVKDFDADRFKKAAALLAEKHEILRTVFYTRDYLQPVQLVLKQTPVDVEYYDISSMDRAAQEEYIENYMAGDRQASFDLSQPLWRLRTFGLGGDRLMVLVVCHHAILDGWSVASLATELNNTYIKLAAKPSYRPRKLKSSYRDYIIEQIAEKTRGENAAFWKKELEGYKRLDLLASGVNSGTAAGPGMYQVFPGWEVVVRLKETARKYNTSIKHLFFAAFTYSVFMLSPNNDIVVGLVANNRPTCEDGDKILGCFLNTVPIRLRIPCGITWESYIQLVEKKMLQMKSYDRFSFYEIVRLLDETTDQRNPIFDVIFNFADFHVYHQALPVHPDSKENTGKQPDGDNRLGIINYAKTNLPLVLSVGVTVGVLSLSFNYDRSCLSDQWIQEYCRYFQRVLDKLTGDPASIMHKNDIIPGEEKQKLLTDFNATEKTFPGEKLLHQLFEEQVERTPGHIAVVGPLPGKNRTYKTYMTYITYRELNKKSDQLAYSLRERGTGPDTIVGLLAERSIEMVMGILGILKAGGAYLPIEPDSPGERIKYILNDAKVRILVNYSKNIGITIDGEAEKSGLSCGQPLAYVIYTSGSTGKSKGVLVHHGAVVNTLVCRKEEYKMTPADTALQLFSYVFDGFLTSFFTPILSGARVVILSSREISDINAVKDAISKQWVTHFISVPAFYRAILEGMDSKALASLKLVTLAGDTVSPQLVELTKQKNNLVELSHEYGVTEVAVMSTINRHQERDNRISIGYPVWNTRVYIVDCCQCLQPVGVPGELCIAGSGVARGYLNNPELTAEKFKRAVISHSSLVIGNLKRTVNDHLSFVISSYSKTNDRSSKLITNDQCPMTNDQYPMTNDRSSKLYRTGDLARWLPGGTIEFLGRMDRQVKIRGFRIEPGEIEARLSCHPQVQEAVVIDREAEKGDKYLIAYFVLKKSSGGQRVDTLELKKYLAEALPPFMIPSYFIPLERIPLTPGGKVNREVLSSREVKPGTGEEYIAPGNEIEEKLAGIWSKILGIKKERIGKNDDFFKLGGDSLKSMILVNHCNELLGEMVPTGVIFEAPTLTGLALYFTENYPRAAEALKMVQGDAKKDIYMAIPLAEAREYYPLTYNQERLWFIQQMEPLSRAFNLPAHIELKYKVNQTHVEKTLGRLMERHESLRTGFRVKDEVPVQYVVDINRVNIPFRSVDISSLDERARNRERDEIYKAEAETLFDLTVPPIFRAVLVKLAEEHYELIFNIHHIITDGWSNNLLIREFSQLYQGCRTGREVNWPPLEFQYKDFSEWHRKRLRDGGLREESHQYWKKKLTNGFPTLKLPADFRDANRNDRTGAIWRHVIDNQLRNQIKRLAEDNKTTLFVVIFSVYLLLLHRFSNQADISCSTMGAGRSHVSLYNIIGFFVNPIPFTTRVDERESFDDFLSRTGSDILEAFRYQNYPPELVVGELKIRYPDITASFNMIYGQEGAGEQDLESPGPYHRTDIQGVKYDLEPYFVEFRNGIEVLWSYKKQLFQPGTIAYMSREYIKMLDYFTTQPHSSYKDYKQGRKKRTLWENNPRPGLEG
jgi:amino acid adenylation domain-containing protein